MRFPFPKVEVPKILSNFWHFPWIKGWQGLHPPGHLHQLHRRLQGHVALHLVPWILGTFFTADFFRKKHGKRAPKKLANIVSKCLKSELDLNNSSISEILAIHSWEIFMSCVSLHLYGNHGMLLQSYRCRFVLVTQWYSNHPGRIRITLRKTNIAPDNNHPFSGAMLVSRGVDQRIGCCFTRPRQTLTSMWTCVLIIPSTVSGVFVWVNLCQR